MTQIGASDMPETIYLSATAGVFFLGLSLKYKTSIAMPVYVAIT